VSYRSGMATENVKVDSRLLDRIRALAKKEDRGLKAQVERLLIAALEAGKK
jgi:hypothetical protein